MKQVTPHILLIHPWITDFAAYNFWIRPLGLLSLASLLRQSGFRVTLIDCLDASARKKEYGDGNLPKKEIEKPTPLKCVPRKYSQYGISEEAFLQRLDSMDRPDVVGVTSGMTYWYPGVVKVIRMVRDRFKGVPIVLGGVYATLCHDHALKHAGADVVFKGGEEDEAMKLILALAGCEGKGSETSKASIEGVRRPWSLYPSFDLYSHLDYVVLATSKGCPFRCPYCASSFLKGGYWHRDPSQVLEEIEHWIRRFQVRNIVFYDDALLVDSRNGVVPMLKEAMEKGIRCSFHAPNGLHAGEIDQEVAGLLYRSGFRTIRLGLETSNERIQVETGSKVNNRQFQEAIEHLKRAGYASEEIGVYVMAGMPGQRVEEVEESILFVEETGSRPILVEYSPVPHTPYFEKAVRFSTFDLVNEPLFHNNTLLPCQWGCFALEDYRRLKDRVRRI